MNAGLGLECLIVEKALKPARHTQWRDNFDECGFMTVDQDSLVAETQ
jgi:hypothetical protein